MPRPHTPTQRLPASQRLCRSICALGLALLGTAAMAQATPPPETTASPSGAAQRPSPKVERITHEDAGSRVDELRVGGQTRQIDVQTKSGLPAYQIRPEGGAHGPASSADQRTGLAGSPGRASWKLSEF